MGRRLYFRWQQFTQSRHWCDFLTGGNQGLVRTVTVSGTGPLIVGGVISNGTNATIPTISLTKSGTGILVLNGANAYTGATTVNAGALVINGSNSLSTGAVAVNGGATLSGTGTIAGSVTLAGGTSLSTQGTINLQDGAIGTLTLSNGLTIGSGGNNSNLMFDLGSGGVHDLLAVTAGNITMTGTAVISVDDLNTSLSTGTYTLITGTSGLGTANFILASSTITVSGTTYNLSLSGTSTAEFLTVTTGSGAPGVPTSAFWTGSQSGTWNTLTGGTLSNFNTDATSGVNTGALPGVGTNVVFTTSSPAPGNLSTTLGQDFTINSLTFNARAAAQFGEHRQLEYIDHQCKWDQRQRSW